MTEGAKVSWLGARRREFRAAGGLLTRLPLGTLDQGIPANSVWAYPIFGVVVGFCGAATYGVAHFAKLSPAFAAVAALLATVLASGALHEDGLADFWDGIGGGATRQRKLEIMADSRIGSYGVIALILAFGARWTAIAALATPAAVGLSLIAAHCVSRGALAAIFLLLRPAKSEGLGASAGRPAYSALLVAVVIAVAVVVLLLPAVESAAALLCSLFAVLLVAWLAYRQLGGYTGDVFGAGQQIAEIAVLWALAGLAVAPA